MLLRTLGHFDLLTSGPAGEPEVVMGAQKPLALLAYLALAPRRRASRDELLELLWSDVPSERGRSTLRQTLWILRQRLGKEALATEGDYVALVHPLRLDCEEFREAIAAGNLTEAWHRYEGHFLPAFAAPGAVAFEQWADGQREKFRAMWTAVGEKLATGLAAAGNAREAAGIARRLRDEHPHRLDFWRLLLNALLAAGDRMHALIEAEALEALSRAGELPLSPESRALVDRIRAATGGEESTAPARVQADLVGRSTVFAALLAGWREATRGRGRMMAVEAAPGLGKTRLLGDFASRLGDATARVVQVRAWPADRDLPYGLAATLAEALSHLPGALGISAGSASALVDLAPDLSNIFSHTEPAPTSAEDLRRVRTRALAELLEACAEEGPVAILVDDLHWADESSRQVLLSLLPRLANLAVLLVVTTRPLRNGSALPQGTALLPLPPLTEEQVQSIIEGVAAGDPPLMRQLAALVHQVSAGVPLMVLATLELALERQLLLIAGGAWSVPDLEALARVLRHGSVLEQMLRDLPSAGLEWLLALALARRPLPEAILAGVTPTTAPALLASTLEQRALLHRVEGEWDLAHDRIGEAALAIATAPQRDAVALRLADSLVASTREPQPRNLQAAGRLLHVSEPGRAARFFRQWLRAVDRRPLWRNRAEGAKQFLGEGAAPQAVRQLAGSVGLTDRLLRGHPGVALAAAFLLLVALGTGVRTMLMAGGGAPAVAMFLTEPPTSRGFIWSYAAGQSEGGTEPRSEVPSHIEFRDGEGHPTLRTPTVVTVHLVEAADGLRLEGDTLRPVEQGRANFDDLRVVGSGPFRLEFRAGTLPPIHTRRIYSAAELGPSPWIRDIMRLHLAGGELNGQRLDPEARRVIVAPGDTLEGFLSLRSVTASATAAILVGAVALWGDRRTNWMTLGTLPSYGEGTLTRPLEDAVTGRRFRAPDQPGTYRILLTYAAETEMRFIASRTNWKIGTPRWFDGDDLADLGPAELAVLDSAGILTWPRLILRDDRGPGMIRQEDHDVIGTTIEVVVRPPRP